jgi:RNA polymerase sigma factor (sigma-70 family)
MASGHVLPVLRCLRDFLRRGQSVDSDPDAQLLQRFVATRDELAFEALLRRHGPMVLGVCRRLLLHAEDAEDAFQATFLILARKAARLRRRELLGPWLYGVASRTAARARVDLARRRNREQQVVPREAEPPDDSLIWRDLRPVLDEEVGRLPERYRAAFVLCYLQGLTNKEAALTLGCPQGTVLSRLAWARARLRSRLTRRGVTLSAAAISSALLPRAAAAIVPAGLMTATTAAVVRRAAGVVASGPITRLTEEVLRAMWMTKVKAIAVLALALAAVGIGLGVMWPAPAQGSPQPAVPQPTQPVAPAPAAAGTPREGAQAPQDPRAKGKAATPVVGKEQAREDVTRELIPVLIEALKDKDSQIFITAEQTLRKLGRPAVPAVIPLLSSKYPELRRSAIRILGGMGDGVDEAVAALNRHLLDEEALAEALRDRDGVVQTVAQDTVVRLGKAAVPALVRMVEGKDAHLRAMALDFLGAMGNKAVEAVPALTRVFQKAVVQEERRAALTAISRIVAPSQSDWPAVSRPGKSPRRPGGKSPSLP